MIYRECQYWYLLLQRYLNYLTKFSANTEGITDYAANIVSSKSFFRI